MGYLSVNYAYCSVIYTSESPKPIIQGNIEKQIEECEKEGSRLLKLAEGLREIKEQAK